MVGMALADEAAASCRRAGVEVRPYAERDVAAMRRIWNQVVDAANAFPQTDGFPDDDAAAAFFASQTRCAVAVDGAGKVVGLYILHPNNVGRCAHVANASYAVDAPARGRGAGRALVLDSLASLGECGFRGLQFNAVVASNVSAQRLYESIGFTRIGAIPGGFRNGDGVFEDMFVYYRAAEER